MNEDDPVTVCTGDVFQNASSFFPDTKVVSEERNDEYGRVRSSGVLDARDGLYTYYRATILGTVILEHGVEELLRRERDFSEAYDSSTRAESH